MNKTLEQEREAYFAYLGESLIKITIIMIVITLFLNTITNGVPP